MLATINLLSNAGIKSIGMCSSLWTDSEGKFSAGLFYFHEYLHLVVKIAGEQFWIVPVTKESVDVCLRGTSTLFKLASNQSGYCILTRMVLHEPRLIHKIRMCYVLKTSQPILIPNYYYIWNQYLFSIDGV